MSDLKPRGVPIEFDGVERHFLFTLNTIDALQEKYDKNLYEIINDLTDAEVADRTLRELVTFLLNEEADREKRLGGRDLPEVTEHDVGDMIGFDNYYEVTKAVMEAYGVSMPDPNEASNDPN